MDEKEWVLIPGGSGLFQQNCNEVHANWALPLVNERRGNYNTYRYIIDESVRADERQYGRSK